VKKNALTPVFAIAFSISHLQCGDDETSDDGTTPPAEITFGAMGSLSAAAGKGAFRFGAASAATQIEDQNIHTDWYAFTQPTAEGGLGKGTFVGDAAKGYTFAIEDVKLLQAMNVDSYRFSIEWARIEPSRDMIDEAAIAHYRSLLEALKAAGIRPVVTVHHFSNPTWIHDPKDAACLLGVSDTNLCGFGHPTGGAEVIAEAEEHAELLGERFGDLVDEWGTVNEPINYLLAAYGVGSFPPGRSLILSETSLLEEFMPVVRDYLRVHAAIYRGLKAKDTVDADGDGDAASVGLSLSVAEWVASQANEISEDPIDVSARDKVIYVYHHLFVDAIREGKFDADLDLTLEESLPEVKDTIDWLGVQYYFRTGVTGTNALVPVLNLTPCFGIFDLGSCLPPTSDPTHCVPAMRYEFYEEGLYNVLKDFSSRWPDLPMVVSESGLATENGVRRAEHVVRSLEQIARSRDEGADVRGYYHWSLYDNFEWAEGFIPRFGLYRVNYDSYAREPTEGAEVLGVIAKARKITGAQRSEFGGTGPMSPEPGYEAGPTCAQ
jgi:beta-glucosidase/6-phospho-beta-glucosidase/beta-galactosidase